MTLGRIKDGAEGKRHALFLCQFIHDEGQTALTVRADVSPKRFKVFVVARLLLRDFVHHFDGDSALAGFLADLEQPTADGLNEERLTSTQFYDAPTRCGRVNQTSGNRSFDKLQCRLLIQAAKLMRLSQPEQYVPILLA